MREYFEIGTTPAGEDCAQVGKDGYYEAARHEARVFIAQLIRKFGEPPAGAGFMVKGFPHDFGTYYEVCVFYQEPDIFDDGDADEPEERPDYTYALAVENAIPELWDAEAKQQLTAVNTA